MASSGGFWLTGGAGTMGDKPLRMIMRQSGEMICKHLRCGQMLAYRSHGVRGYSTEIRGQRSGMRWSRFVVSQVPKSEAPGAPIFSGCAHFSRHLGHPPTPHHFAAPLVVSPVATLYPFISKGKNLTTTRMLEVPLSAILKNTSTGSSAI